MGKGKKGGKRLTKKQLVPKLEELFSSNPGKTMSFKEIFRSLHLDTHPLKMLAIDIMEEMAWDDFITKVSDNSYQLNQKGQVQEGVFLRKTNGKNTITPDGSDKPIFRGGAQLDVGAQRRPRALLVHGTSQEPYKGGAGHRDSA